MTNAAEETVDKNNGTSKGHIIIWLMFGLQVFAFLQGNIGFLLKALRGPSFQLIGMAYAFNTLLMPAVFFLGGLCGLLRWLKHKQSTRLIRISIVSILFAVACLGTRVYATYIEPSRLVVRRVEITTSKVTKPFRILHISDIQSDGVGEYEERAFRIMRELKPDLVLHTGDLLQPLPPATLGSETPKIAKLFETLEPSGGKFTVIGDVDGWLALASETALGGLELLKSQNTTVSIDGTRFQIMGLSLSESRRGSDLGENVERWLDTTEESDFTIVMGHAPDYVLGLSDLDVDLCLAGHTHGGQVRIPFYGPIMTLSKVPRKLARGFHLVGQTRLNVSAGVGNEHSGGIPAIRLNCPTEMTLIELLP